MTIILIIIIIISFFSLFFFLRPVSSRKLLQVMKPVPKDQLSFTLPSIKLCSDKVNHHNWTSLLDFPSVSSFYFHFLSLCEMAVRLILPFQRSFPGSGSMGAAMGKISLQKAVANFQQLIKRQVHHAPRQQRDI